MKKIFKWLYDKILLTNAFEIIVFLFLMLFFPLNLVKYLPLELFVLGLVLFVFRWGGKIEEYRKLKKIEKNYKHLLLLIKKSKQIKNLQEYVEEIEDEL